VKNSFVILFICMLLGGCTINEEPLNLKITTTKSTLGVFEVDPTYEIFGYEIRIENKSTTPADVDYAEPLIASQVKNRMKETDLKLLVNGTMSKGNFFTLKKDFLFKSDDLSKEEISTINIIEGVLLHMKNGESYIVKNGPS
jgi:hypothetical protein